MANSAGCCSKTATELLQAILQENRDSFVRMGQIIQAFEDNGGQAPTSEVTPPSDACMCNPTQHELLIAILEQRQANFDRLQQIIQSI